MLALAKQRKMRKAACQQVSDLLILQAVLNFYQHHRFQKVLMPFGQMILQALRSRCRSIFFLMLRRFSCLRCNPRPKLRTTEGFTILLWQRSYVRSNIQKHLSVFFFLSSVVSPLKLRLRTIDAIRNGTLPVTAQLLPAFLFPDDHVHDPNDISLNVLRGHIMIRVFLIYFCLFKATFFSRPQSICFKAPQLLSMNLGLTVENTEMQCYAAWHRWLLIQLRTLPSKYVLTILLFFLPMTICQTIGTLRYEFDEYMVQ